MKRASIMVTTSALIATSLGVARADPSATTVSVQAPAAAPVGSAIEVAGLVAYGADVFVVEDPPDHPGNQAPAQAVGADIRRATITSDPSKPAELEFAIEVSSQPQVFGRVPQVLFEWDILVDRRPLKGGDYGGPQWMSTDVNENNASVDPVIVMASCLRQGGGCTYTQLEGGFDLQGGRVFATVGLADIGAKPGSVIGPGPLWGNPDFYWVNIWSGLHEHAAGGQSKLNVDTALQEAEYVVPTREVRVGIVPAGAPDPSILPVAAIPDGEGAQGSYSAALPTEGFSPGSYEIVARACWGTNCGTARAPMELT